MPGGKHVLWNNETHIVCAVVRASAVSASYARHFLYFSSSHPTWPALLVVLPEYEDLALYAEKTRELRAHLSPFNSLNNWSRRLQGLEVERIGMDMVLSVPSVLH